MASRAAKSAACSLSLLNIFLYFILIVLTSRIINVTIERSHKFALSIPARIFPIFFPIGNLATGFLIIYSLLAGVVGIATSVIGLQNVTQWNSTNLHAAAASSTTSLSLTLLAFGLACKEIDLGSNLRGLEVVIILVTASQLLCTVAIYSGVEDVIELEKM